MKEELSKYFLIIGFLTSGVSFFVSVLLGFGGFDLSNLFNYSISNFVSKAQITFLAITTIGFLLLITGLYFQSKKTLFKLYLPINMILAIIAIIGSSSQMINSNFWSQTNFTDTNTIFLFSNLTLLSFAYLGVLQIITSTLLLKNRFKNSNQLSKIFKIIILFAGILFLIKAIIDYPLLKEAILILSYMYKIPVLNNIINIISPILFLTTHLILTFLANKK